MWVKAENKMTNQPPKRILGCYFKKQRSRARLLPYRAAGATAACKPLEEGATIVTSFSGELRAPLKQAEEPSETVVLLPSKLLGFCWAAGSASTAAPAWLR